MCLTHQHVLKTHLQVPQSRLFGQTTALRRAVVEDHLGCTVPAACATLSSVYNVVSLGVGKPGPLTTLHRIHNLNHVLNECELSFILVFHHVTTRS